jgi:hypothetical protein
VNASIPDQSAASVKEWNPAGLEEDYPPVLVQVGDLDNPEGLLGRNGSIEQPGQLSCFMERHEIKRRLAQHLVGSVTEGIKYVWTDVGVYEPVVHLPDQITGRFDQIAESLTGNMGSRPSYPMTRHSFHQSDNPHGAVGTGPWA